MTVTGVLTKLDIMDPGTNAREVLDGQSVKLKHGWIGVVNRGQADINSRVCPAQGSDRGSHGEATASPVHLDCTLCTMGAYAMLKHATFMCCAASQPCKRLCRLHLCALAHQAAACLPHWLVSFDPLPQSLPAAD